MLNKEIAEAHIFHSCFSWQNTSLVLQEKQLPTASYMAWLLPDKQLFSAAADMRIFSRLTADYVWRALDPLLQPGSLVALDANIEQSSGSTALTLAELCFRTKKAGAQGLFLSRCSGAQICVSMVHRRSELFSLNHLLLILPLQ